MWGFLSLDRLCWLKIQPYTVYGSVKNMDLKMYKDWHTCGLPSKLKELLYLCIHCENLEKVIYFTRMIPKDEKVIGELLWFEILA